VKFTQIGEKFVRDNVTEIAGLNKSDSDIVGRNNNNSSLNETVSKEEPVRVNLNMELESEMKAEIIRMKDLLRRIDDVISRSNYG